MKAIRLVEVHRPFQMQEMDVPTIGQYGFTFKSPQIVAVSSLNEDHSSRGYIFTIEPYIMSGV